MKPVYSGFFYGKFFLFSRIVNPCKGIVKRSDKPLTSEIQKFFILPLPAKPEKMNYSQQTTNPFKDYFYLGKITKVHGYEGKLIAFLDVDDPGAYSKLDMIFINVRGQLIPHFIETSSLKNNKLIVKLQDIDDAEASASLVNCELYLPLTKLPKLSGNKFYYHEIIGFELIDDEFGRLGAISDVLEYPNQAVIQLFYEDKEVLIPISEEVIRKVDRKNRIIRVHSPEGLLDVYLND